MQRNTLKIKHLLTSPIRVGLLLAMMVVSLGSTSGQPASHAALVAKAQTLAPAKVQTAFAPVAPIVVTEVVDASFVAPIVVEEVMSTKRYASTNPGDLLARIRACESGGNYGAVSSSGTYRGAYQFDYRTWQSVGGSGDPAAASAEEQDARASQLYAQRGGSPWPICSHR